MKDAQAQSSSSSASASSESDRPTQSRVLGIVESAAGKVTGCEGMEAEGQQRLPHGAGSEETSGTG